MLACASPAWADPIAGLSIDLTTAPAEDFSKAVEIALAAGASATSLSLLWSEMEPDGHYAPETDWAAIANAYYPTVGLDLTLTLSVIDTVTDGRPSDLQNLAWSDPEVTQRFARFASEVLMRMPDVTIPVVAIGNEVDGVLSSPAAIADYAVFLGAARQSVQTLRKDTPVGVKITFASLLEDPAKWAPLLAVSDAILLTDYPLTADFHLRPPETVKADMAALHRLALGRPIYLLEAGYPSAGCDTTAQDQAAFYAALFEAWDQYRDVMPLISLTWLTDLSQPEAEGYAAYYGLGQAECFVGYLASLGLRSNDGTAKPALTWLLQRQQRGG